MCYVQQREERNSLAIAPYTVTQMLRISGWVGWPSYKYDIFLFTQGTSSSKIRARRKNGAFQRKGVERDKDCFYRQTFSSTYDKDYRNGWWWLHIMNIVKTTDLCTKKMLRWWKVSCMYLALIIYIKSNTIFWKKWSFCFYLN